MLCSTGPAGGKLSALRSAIGSGASVGKARALVSAEPELIASGFSVIVQFVEILWPMVTCTACPEAYLGSPDGFALPGVGVE